MGFIFVIKLWILTSQNNEEETYANKQLDLSTLFENFGTSLSTETALVTPTPGWKISCSQ